MNQLIQYLREAIFKIESSESFNLLSNEIFRYQAAENPVYSEYLRLVGRNANTILDIKQIPFLPIHLFKSHHVIAGNAESEIIFESSGTSGQISSRHFVADKQLYIESFTRCFDLFFGNPMDYCVLALLPSYLERENSSLVLMADKLIRNSGNPLSGFFLKNYQELSDRLKILERNGQKTMLLGVSFALLEFAEKYPMMLNHTIVMETGGMKGKRKEITRQELHEILKKAFSLKKIYSEYGMTELLSQAYSLGDGIFNTPPWMKILIRNPFDPFEYLPAGTTGGINIIDLANIHSCSFIQTDDLGKLNDDGTFEVIGRLDNAELRGCNLMLET